MDVPPCPTAAPPPRLAPQPRLPRCKIWNHHRRPHTGLARGRLGLLNPDCTTTRGGDSQRGRAGGLRGRAWGGGGGGDGGRWFLGPRTLVHRASLAWVSEDPFLRTVPFVQWLSPRRGPLYTPAPRLLPSATLESLCAAAPHPLGPGVRASRSPGPPAMVARFCFGRPIKTA